MTEVGHFDRGREGAYEKIRTDILTELKYMNVPPAFQPQAALILFTLRDYAGTGAMLGSIEEALKLRADVEDSDDHFDYYLAELSDAAAAALPDALEENRKFLSDLNSTLYTLSIAAERREREEPDEPLSTHPVAQIKQLFADPSGLYPEHVSFLFDEAMELIAQEPDPEQRIGDAYAVFNELFPLYRHNPSYFPNFWRSLFSVEAEAAHLRNTDTKLSAHELQQDVHDLILNSLTSGTIQPDQMRDILEQFGAEVPRPEVANALVPKERADRRARLGMLWERLIIAVDEQNEKDLVRAALSMPATRYFLKSADAKHLVPGLRALHAIHVEKTSLGETNVLLEKWLERETQFYSDDDVPGILALIGSYANAYEPANDTQTKRTPLLTRIREFLTKDPWGTGTHEALLRLTVATNPAELDALVEPSDWGLLSTIARDRNDLALMEKARALLRKEHGEDLRSYAVASTSQSVWRDALLLYEREAVMLERRRR